MSSQTSLTTRRQFLQRTTWGFGSAFVLPSLLQSCMQDHVIPDPVPPIRDLPPPTAAEILQVQTNVNNMMDWLNHVHDYLQDVINEVYSKISESPSYDPSQKFVTNLLDAGLWSLGSVSFPGAGIVSSFLGTFFGSYSGPNTPPDLSGTFGDVWDRFDKTFLQAEDDLSAIYNDVAGNWSNTYTNSETGVVDQVAILGNSAVNMPSKTDTLYQTMTDKAVADFKVALTKQTLGRKWSVLQPTGQIMFETWSESQLISWAKTFVPQHPSMMITYKPDTGGSGLSPQKGYDIFENYLGSGSGYLTAGTAPDDLCNWLFQDDGFGTITNANGIAQRKDVFYNWGLGNSLTAVSQAIDDTITPSTSPADQVNAAKWVQSFTQTSRQQVERQIIGKAQQDAAFRNQLLSDPKTALLSLLGITLPGFISLEIIQETPDTLIMVLPVIGGPDASQAVQAVNVGAWPNLFSQTPRQEVEKQIMLKSQQDSEFRRGLVKSPKATLQSFLGITFPNSVQVQVIQETPDKYKLVLPQH